MNYNPQIPIDSFFNQVKYLLEYLELARFLYTHIQTTNIDYTILNKTRKFQNAIKTWDWMNPIHKNWINFNTHFHIAHRELEETGELTMKDVGFHQYHICPACHFPTRLKDIRRQHMYLSLPQYHMLL